MRIPVRRFASGITHLADVPEDFPTVILTSFDKMFDSPIGPLVSLCATSLDGCLVHMQKMGTARTSPKGCRTCLRLHRRDQRLIVGSQDRVITEKRSE